jgi:hypothetical protein
MAKSAPQSLVVSVLGFIITALVILSVPMILIQEGHRGESFWQRVLWTEFLALLVWGSVLAQTLLSVDRKLSTQGLAGMLPCAMLVICGYAIISFLMMMCRVAADEEYGRFHLVAQIIVASIASLMLLLLSLARGGAVKGLEPIPAEVQSPPNLCVVLKYQEDRFNSSSIPPEMDEQIRRVRDALKALREKIQYSLQSCGSIGSNTEYRSFASDVQRLCDEVANVNLLAVDNSLLLSIVQESEELARRSLLLAQHLRQ